MLVFSTERQSFTFLELPCLQASSHEACSRYAFFTGIFLVDFILIGIKAGYYP